MTLANRMVWASRRRLARAFVLASLLAGAASASAEERTLSFFHIHTKESITVTYKKDGKFVPEGLKKLNHFMRDWRRNMEINMDPAVFDIIWQLHEELGSKQPVHVICGYRSAATNENLRRTVGGQAKHSRHITGQAVDLMFPDVPLKQLRYSALIMERGGVGYYPASGLPFVHVDTGNVRHWPRVPRMELAALFPNGHSKHVPADGRPLTREDARVALARLKASGGELAWALTHKHAGPMLASLTPSDAPAKPTLVSLSPDPDKDAAAASPKAPAKPESLAKDTAEKPEIQLSEEGEEQEDEIVFEPLPATFLLAEHPLDYADEPEKNARPEVFPKVALLMSPPSVLASEEFERRLQMEALYEMKRFAGPAVAAMIWRRERTKSAEANQGNQTAR